VHSGGGRRSLSERGKYQGFIGSVAQPARREMITTGQALTTGKHAALV
jgi:hypothetical protein